MRADAAALPQNPLGARNTAPGLIGAPRGPEHDRTECLRRTRSSSVERDSDLAERSEVRHARVARVGLEHVGRDTRCDDVTAT